MENLDRKEEVGGYGTTDLRNRYKLKSSCLTGEEEVARLRKKDKLNLFP